MVGGRSLGCLFLVFVALVFVVGISISLRHISDSAPSSGLHQSNIAVFPIVNPASGVAETVTMAPRVVLTPKAEPHVSLSPAVQLLSRRADVEATCDVRGNLGPCRVVIQDNPGKDWLKDRWQAASDMGGTAIPGTHWVQLDFKRIVRVQSVVLDWETAYALDYVLYGRLNENEEWKMIYDGGTDIEKSGYICDDLSDFVINVRLIWFLLHRKGRRRSEKTGQSPGVKSIMPLHVVHYLNWTFTNGSGGNPGSRNDNESSYSKNGELRFLKLFIKKPAVGWGVSLWQFDVYGSILSTRNTTTAMTYSNSHAIV